MGLTVGLRGPEGLLEPDLEAPKHFKVDMPDLKTSLFLFLREGLLKSGQRLENASKIFKEEG